MAGDQRVLDEWIRNFGTFLKILSAQRLVNCKCSPLIAELRFWLIGFDEELAGYVLRRRERIACVLLTSCMHPSIHDTADFRG